MGTQDKRDPSASLDERRRSLEEMAVAVVESVEANGGTVERVNQKEMKVTLPGVEKPIRVVLVRVPRMKAEELVLAKRFIDHYKRTRQPS